MPQSRFSTGLISGFLLALLVVAGSIYLALISGIINPSADEPIPGWERWMAKTSIRAFLKRETPKTTNPLKPTPQVLNEAVYIYVNNCAVCHGFADNKETVIGKGLYKKPNLFADEDWSEDADGLVFWFIDRGVKLTGMPSFKHTLKEDEIWKLVAFIKNIKKLPPETKSLWHSFDQASLTKQPELSAR